jgi:RNA polymerase sigma factor (sigma-70 family)
LGELDQLYVKLSGRLVAIVRTRVRASDAVVDDACQFAWSRLLLHAEEVRPESALAWLAQTATREAMRLLRLSLRELSLDVTDEETPDLIVGFAPGPEEVFEQRERLASLSRLPERQQRMLWLQGLGLSYADIAKRTGCTLRTVERQLMRAKDSLRMAA